MNLLDTLESFIVRIASADDIGSKIYAREVVQGVLIELGISPTDHDSEMGFVEGSDCLTPSLRVTL